MPGHQTVWAALWLQCYDMNCEDEIILLSGELQDAMAVQYQAMIMCKIVLDILGGQKVDLI